MTAIAPLGERRRSTRRRKRAPGSAPSRAIEQIARAVGDRNWWLPKRLRWLPEIRHEGEVLPAQA